MVQPMTIAARMQGLKLKMEMEMERVRECRYIPGYQILKTTSLLVKCHNRPVRTLLTQRLICLIFCTRPFLLLSLSGHANYFEIPKYKPWVDYHPHCVRTELVSFYFRYAKFITLRLSVTSVLMIRVGLAKVKLKI